MKLLPTKQTSAQQESFLSFFETGKLELREPCDCGSMIRHNNGGNYHRIVEFRLDAGKCWRTETFTGDYGPPDDWKEVEFSEAVDEIASLSAEGW
jgi:hypothetical protein